MKRQRVTGRRALVQVEGIAELRASLQALPEKIQGRPVRSALRAGAQVIRREARRLVHVRTGDLRDSIVVQAPTKREKRRKGLGEIVVGFLSPTSRRAHLEEFGTRHTDAHPFMRPALDTRGQAAITAIRKQLSKRIEAEARKLAGKRPVRRRRR